MRWMLKMVSGDIVGSNQPQGFVTATLPPVDRNCRVMVPLRTRGGIMVLHGTTCGQGELMDGEDSPVRDRILEAAFAAFRERGYATTSTLEIAQRARVSKRELY